jgi:hypothetical protein
MFKRNGRQLLVHNIREKACAADPGHYFRSPGFPSRIRCRSAALAVKLAQLFASSERLKGSVPTLDLFS